MTEFNSEQWDRIRQLFEAVLEQPAAERATFLSSAAEDEIVRAQVREMLLTWEQAAGFLEQPVALNARLSLNDRSEETSLEKRIGQYRLLREIGRGGMATVYQAVRADDPGENTVALKLVWPGLNSQEILRRFQQEQEILARLNHPNIARLLDSGTTDDGWPYLVMEYVDGQPIHEYCEQRALAITERLKLFGSVCEAVEYAHQKLIIHRDLKPSNIFVTTDGRVKLLDFGIARLLAPEAAAPTRTRTGLHLMTPEYASPEQIRQEAVTPASDVWSLGVVLYELLTGHRPWRFNLSPLLLPQVLQHIINTAAPVRPSVIISRTVTETDLEGRLVTTHSPALVSATREGTEARLRARLAGDLDNIVLTALRPEPTQRYRSAAQFSDDLRRHLNGEPVRARGNSRRYRLGKFLRRHKLSLVMATLALLLLSLFAPYQQRQQRAQRRQLYATQINQAAQDWDADNLARMQETLARWQTNSATDDLRGFEWRYLWRLLHRERLLLPGITQPDTVAFLGGNNRHLLLDTKAGEALMIDAETGQQLQRLTYPSDALVTTLESQVYVSENKQKIKIINLLTGQTLRTMQLPAPISTFIIIKSDQQEALLTGDAAGKITVYELSSGHELRSFRLQRGPVRRLAVSLDRQRIVAETGANDYQLCDLSSGRVLREFREPDALFPTPDSSARFLSQIIGGKTIVISDLETGHEIARRTEAGPLILTSLLSPDSRLLATGTTDRLVRLYELPSLRQVAVFRGHTDWVHAVAFSAKTQLLASAGSDRTIRLWDLQTYKELASIKGHLGEIRGLSFSDDGQQVISLGLDQTVRIWDVAKLLRADVLKNHTDNVFTVAFSPDGKLLATGSADRLVKLWDTQSGNEAKTLRGHNGWVFATAFSPDGAILATGGNDHLVILWDVVSGREIRRFIGHDIAVRSIAFAPDGKTFATAGSDDTVRLWETATGRELKTLRDHRGEVLSVTFSADARRLVSTGWDQKVNVWDAQTGQLLATLRGHSNPVWAARFSPDGQTLATGSMDSTVKLWDAVTLKEKSILKGHADEVFSLAFSPDGTRLATASNDRTVKLWNLETGQELLTLRNHTDQVWSVAFSPDGTTLATGGWDKTARLWRTVKSR